MQRMAKFYASFDRSFFGTWNNSGDCAGRYAALLSDNSRKLDASLSTWNPRELTRDFYSELSRLSMIEVKHSELIKKTYALGVDRLDVTIDELAAAAGVSLSGDQRTYADGRINAHLARLIFPKRYSANEFLFENISAEPVIEVCSDFGKSLLQYAAKQPTKEEYCADYYKPADHFSNVAGIEGSDTFIFWTIAPYVHLNLQERGIPAAASIEKIVAWAQEADKRIDLNTSRDDRLDFCRSAKRHLSMRSQLGLDERMPSHLLARLIALDTAKDLVSKMRE